MLTFFFLIIREIQTTDRQTSNMGLRLKEIMSGLLTQRDCYLLEFAGEVDHMHLPFEAAPTVKLSDLVKNLTSVSVGHMRK